jgi:hypothetical protein
VDARISLVLIPKEDSVRMFRTGHIAKGALGIAALVAALALVGSQCYRLMMIPENPKHPTRIAMGDFRDVIYFPSRAVLAGVNPYDDRQDDNPDGYRSRYPAGNNLPFYSPLIFVFAIPFGLLPLWPSVVSWWLLNAGLTVVLAYVAWRYCGSRPTIAMTALLAAAIVVSRPGRSNLCAGQATLIFTLAGLTALNWARTRPWLAGIALTIASIKPTIGGPLAILLLARRDWKPAVTAMVISTVAAVIGLAIIFGPQLTDGTLLQILSDNQTHTGVDPSFNPQITYSRIDASLVVERLFGPATSSFSRLWLPLLILGVASAVVWRFSQSEAGHGPEGADGASRLFTIIALLTTVVCIYHNIYDALLLVVPIMLACPWTGDKPLVRSRWRQMLIFALLLIPALSYFSSNQISARIEPLLAWLGATTHVAKSIGIGVAVANGLALLAAWAMLLTATLAHSNVPNPASRSIPNPGRSNRTERLDSCVDPQPGQFPTVQS